MKEDTKRKIYQTAIAFFTFWILDVIFHQLGVGESNFYFISKFANSLLFAIIWFFIFNKKEHWKKFIYAFIFGTWITSYYLAASYSGFIQFLGIYARYSPPPFVFLGVHLHPATWWFFHSLTFYIGIELAEFFFQKNKNESSRKKQ
ncbi:hypothetical protein HYT55_04325 [Candidatus Woesearchaeota archaeon]|nr:hypothetical protein [Candidatus Woesearchaeota archaeon]